MRKFILIAGFVLASATAQAGDNRSLSLSDSDLLTTAAPAKATDASQTAEAPQATEAPKAEAPKYIERPASVEPNREFTGTESRRPVFTRTASRRAEKPRRNPSWTEARILNELHRYGIYW
jgi:hypothetical protein